tara:strand:- start:51 stop:209 length:159 start_codon:yes stop_codon:yes gene_type:complete
MSDKYIQVKVTTHVDVPIEDLVDESIREWISDNIDLENDCDTHIEVLGVCNS